MMFCKLGPCFVFELEASMGWTKNRQGLKCRMLEQQHNNTTLITTIKNGSFQVKIQHNKLIKFTGKMEMQKV